MKAEQFLPTEHIKEVMAVVVESSANNNSVNHSKVHTLIKPMTSLLLIV